MTPVVVQHRGEQDSPQAVERARGDAGVLDVLTGDDIHDLDHVEQDREAAHQHGRLLPHRGRTGFPCRRPGARSPGLLKSIVIVCVLHRRSGLLIRSLATRLNSRLPPIPGVLPREMRTGRVRGSSGFQATDVASRIAVTIARSTTWAEAAHTASSIGRSFGESVRNRDLRIRSVITGGERKDRVAGRAANVRAESLGPGRHDLRRRRVGTRLSSRRRQWRPHRSWC